MLYPNESFLQYIWQHQLLEGELRTAEGQLVSIERPGLLNRDAGPDFFDARIWLDGTLWVGNVEIHVKSSDWNHHRHSTNPAYHNVVLHVVFENDTAITLQDTHTLPTLSVANYIPQAVWDNYTSLLTPPDEIAIPCGDRISSLPSFFINSTLERLTLERLESKCNNVRQLLADTHGSWEQTCYWLIAHYFGGKSNAFPFELLARSTDMNLIARWRDRPQRIEALFLGQAGMLENYFTDEYPRLLQSDYEAIRQGAKLTPLSSHLWKFFRLRPYSFPTIRISQFAALLCQSHNLFAHLLDTPDAVQLQQFFDVAASDYWTHHFQFDKPSPGKPKKLGSAFVQVLIINAWVPLLFEYGNQHGNQSYKDQAVSILEQLPPERNNIITQCASVGLKPSSAAQSQALLQLFNQHCTPRTCLSCPIGYKVITSNTK
ncbi:MAG: DUF2851 family protein [Bacteroidales bacterium]|nr:DUF2851 family protein [Bacteroidales bacterium]